MPGGGNGSRLHARRRTRPESVLGDALVRGCPAGSHPVRDGHSLRQRTGHIPGHLPGRDARGVPHRHAWEPSTRRRADLLRVAAPAGCRNWRSRSGSQERCTLATRSSPNPELMDRPDLVSCRAGLSIERCVPHDSAVSSSQIYDGLVGRLAWVRFQSLSPSSHSMVPAVSCPMGRIRVF